MVDRKNLALLLTMGLLGDRELLDISKTLRLLRDIHQSNRTYRFIHHRSQKKLRRLARRRGAK